MRWVEPVQHYCDTVTLWQDYDDICLPEQWLMMIQQTEQCWWYFIDLVISHNHQNYHSEPPQAITTCHQVIYQNDTNWSRDFYICRSPAIRHQIEIWLFIKIINRNNSKRSIKKWKVGFFVILQRTVIIIVYQMYWSEPIKEIVFYLQP